MSTAETHEIADGLINVVVRPTEPMTEAEFMAWCDEARQSRMG